jgi:hypothetical protein
MGVLFGEEYASRSAGRTEHTFAQIGVHRFSDSRTVPEFVTASS